MAVRKKSASDPDFWVSLSFLTGQQFPARHKPLRALLIPLLFLSCTAANAGEGVEPLHTKVLAASCAACHGTHGNSVSGTPVLAGLDRAYFIGQMQAFADGSRPATVMHHHASGLTSQEIEHLADYFARQPRVEASLPVDGKGQ